MPGPLHGVRVIDLTSMVSGPLATMTLADQGADVIKVENPSGGDHSRHVATRRNGFSASFLNNNRNKRSLVLDLKQDAAIDALKRLVAGADVFVQNFRPGVAERMGLGETVLRGLNPRLIYVSIAGFGFQGPYADKPVFDPLIQGLSGLTTVQAGSDEARPRLVRTIVPDKLTGIQASQAIAAALFARERSGEGQHVHLSMLDTIVHFLWSSDMGGHTFVGDELENETAQSFIDLIYETADGFVTIAVMADKHWVGFCQAVQRPDLIEDRRFRTPELRDINKEARVNLIQELVQRFATAALIETLEAHDVPCSPVLRRRDMIRHPQIAANGIVMETRHDHAGPIRQARHPASFSATRPEHRFGAPAYGAHTREVLGEAGLSEQDIERLVKAGAAVAGDTETAR
jgi:crotonobetainyl-CoA:carnitine CoA-transferase CaiB-like acyl-CoA transferase